MNIKSITESNFIGINITSFLKLTYVVFQTLK